MRPPSPHRRRGSPAFEGTLVLAAALELTGPAAQAATLPVPCLANACLSTPNGPPVPGFVTSGSASATQSGNSLNVLQGSSRAILNWASFNISADGRVQFSQPSSTSIALNRIFQQSPSSIFGQITANGQIYLVNPNGFIFGPTATVNANGLIASSLGISDSTFAQGLLSPTLLLSHQAALQSDGRPYVEDNQGNPVLGPDGKPLAVQVVVDPGAQLSTPGGRLLLAAPTVTNGGSLSAPDGQVVLAAGQAVYLQASSDPNLRGLIVEVDQGGTAWNQLTGAMSADRGNVSMVGLMVNQDGRISATTSVSANGSVRLEAADTFTPAGVSGNTISAMRGGTLELGPQSTIDLEPDPTSTTATSADVQPLPTINLIGNQVLFEGGSIVARGGVLNVQAETDPAQGIVPGSPTTARIRIHPGTSIDLSGTDAELPMSANLLAIQLRANELADDPTQRNGPLRGQTVYVDARVGTSIIGPAALKAAEATVPESVSQRLEQGGSVSFQSEGDVSLAQGAAINVSGGQTTYDAGVLQTTQLIGANGQLYDIGTANPLMSYSGVVNPTFTVSYNKWGVQSVVPTPGFSHYESGYVQGASAGEVQFAAPTMILDGTLEGQAVNGPYQRSGSNVVSGATLILGIPGGLGTVTAASEFLTPPIEFTSTTAPVVAQDSAAILPQPLAMPLDYLTKGGFQNTQIYGDTTVTLPAGLPLPLMPGSSLSITAPRTVIDSDVTALGGSIQVASTVTTQSADPSVGRPGIVIGDGVALDVRGQWTNDNPMLAAGPAAGPTLQNGGTIALSLGPFTSSEGGELVIGNGASLRASGGGWLSSTNVLTAGSGGSISLEALPIFSAVQLGNGIELDAFGMNGAKGGSFTLAGPRIFIGGQLPAPQGWESAQRADDLVSPGSVLHIGGDLFSAYGFSTVNLEATGPVLGGAGSVALAVAPGAQIDAVTQTLELLPGYFGEPSGGTVAAFSQAMTQALPLRQPMSITLGANFDGSAPLNAGLLELETGSQLTADPGSQVILSGLGGVFVDGTIRAPGGLIELRVPAAATSPDLGYQPTQVLEVGPHAVLDVSGSTVPIINNLGLTLGNVLPAGTVELFADRGYAVTDPGSLIDIAGGSSTLEVETFKGSGVYQQQTVGSSAGALIAHSPESISLLGNLEAAAGAGNYGDPAGGSLELDLIRGGNFFTSVGIGGTPLPSAPLNVQLITSYTGAAPAAPDSGLAVVGISQLKAAGIDSLSLTAGSSIEFSSSPPLNLARQVVLNSSTLTVDSGVNASVSANLVELENLNSLSAGPVTQSGNNSLSIRAQQIDLVGAVGVQGVGALSLESAGDVQLIGSTGSQNLLQQSLTIDGNLSIAAARIYPSTLCNCALTALGAGSSITIGQTGVSPGTPLSAGANLTLTADTIDSAGTLLAPFGTISLNAGTSLTLESGSLTSVSANGMTIPFGQTQLGQQQWVYNSSAGVDTITGIPSRQVLLQAPSVTVAKGATVDLSGGGDLYAYEWVPGTGGTQDALAANGSGLYAIMPAMGSPFAPYDPQESGASALTPGSSIYLSGGGGVPAGTYALLPARFALLPGAFLVQLESGYANLAPGHAASLADGTPVVAGYQSFGSTGLHSGTYQGFAIWPGSYGQQLAQYSNGYASSFFAAAAANAGQPAPPSPIDAGALSVSAGTFLALDGSVLGSPSAPSGKSAAIDVSTANLEITDAPAASVPAGTVTLSAATIDSWHAGELVFGGHPSPDGSSIDVIADSVIIGPGAQVSAGTVVLVAGQSIDLQPGSSVLSNSGSTGGAAPAALPTASPVTLTGPSAQGAAFLAVSDSSLSIVSRPGGTATPGVLTLETGATVGSRGAISIDAPSVALAGTVQGAGAAWSLASSSIGFIGQGASSSETLQIDPATLAQMQGAGAVRLSSLGAIDLDVPVSLGTVTAGKPSLSSIALSAQNLNNLAPGGASTFTADTVALAGTGTAPMAPTAGSGSLNVTAAEIDVGPGTLAIGGVSATSLNASSAIAGSGSGGIVTSGNLSLTAPFVAAKSGAQTLFSAPSGSLAINASASSVPAQPAPGTYLGGELDFSALSINQSGDVAAYSGIVNMQATGNIALSGGASVNASGPTLGIGDQLVGAEGGRVTLAAGGNLTLAAGSTVNVSAGSGAPAGMIDLSAGGVADLSGVLNGAAGGGAQGGQLSITAGSLAQGLTALSQVFNTGGFNSEIDVRTLNGSLTLAPGAQLTANQVGLTADTGLVEIGGTISAPGAGQRGAIRLFGGQGVQLDASGALHADSAAGPGGNIELGAGNSGQITLAAGSTITAAGSSDPGSLLIRAPFSTGGTDVNVQLANSNLTQLGQIIVEPIITASIGPAPTAANWTAIQQTVASDMSAAATNITNRLNPPCAGAGCGPSLPLLVRPAVDITSSGALTLKTAPNFAAWRFGGQPVDLTIRAPGSLSIATTLSDGFTTLPRVGAQPARIELTPNYQSASIRLVAGADTASPDPLAVTSAAADLTIAPGGVVRTGTGEIDLVAARDIVFGGAGASVYTAGTPGAASFRVIGSQSIFNFPTRGGDLVALAGRDIVGAPVSEGVSGWQVREGNPTFSTLGQWGVDFDKFAWNLGALGGGDASVSAARDIGNLSVAAADSYGYPTGAAAAVLFPSGGLSVSAGGDINGQFYVADGRGVLSAGGAFSALPNPSSATPVGSSIALGNAQVSVEARTGVVIDAVTNPTVVAQGATSPVLESFYFTYTGNSSLAVRSSAGDVDFNVDPQHIGALLGPQIANGYGTGAGGAAVYPASLTATALTGDLNLSWGGGAALFPSDTGQLSLLAGHDINGTGTLTMSDGFAFTVPTVQTPGPGAPIDAVLAPFASGRHAADPLPVFIEAGQDITGLDVRIPKPAEVIAGRDITDLTLLGQNLLSADFTVVSAGRDFVDTASSPGAQIEVGGPGQVDVLAGRNVDLGFSLGLTTVGNLLNPNLPSASGANLTVMAGLGQSPDYAGFLAKIVAGSSANESQLVSYVQGVDGLSNLGFAQAESDFEQLGADQQHAFLDQVFFSELVLSGAAANTPGGNFSRGYAAIDALFPDSRSAVSPVSPYSGDLTLTFSRIYTLSGGTISLLVPGGMLNVGLANPPPTLGTKPASQLGIVAQGPGDVDIYTKGDVLVNQSRIFTLGGGNILIWSDEGSIDAGRGAKSSISAPPPQILVDAQGNVSIDFGGAVAGSGIRTIQADPTTPPGNVSLIAPEGTVNAGDAGIGASGNINIAAQHVLGLDNIQFGGVATGVPATVSDIGVALSGVSSVANAASSSEASGGAASPSQAASASASQAALSWLDVFVTGLGEENCRTDDLECLKRQKKE